MAKNKNLKRKTTPFIKDKQNESAKVDDEEESASDQEVNIVNFINEFGLRIRFDVSKLYIECFWNRN